MASNYIAFDSEDMTSYRSLLFMCCRICWIV